MKTTQVTPETYIRAESDRQFGVVAKMADGVNRFFHFRRPTPLDKQNIVRMNRDTLYSMAVVDTSKGATITVPELPKDRYLSVYLVDNDHYCPFVIYHAGTHELPRDTQYLRVGVRIQVFNPQDEDEIALDQQAAGSVHHQGQQRRAAAGVPVGPPVAESPHGPV